MVYRINIPENEKVITLIGSTRFKDSFENVERILTLNDKVVLSPGVYLHTDSMEFSRDTKFRLNQLLKNKISLSHAVFVINENGYWGKSTASDICFSRNLEIPIYYVFDSKGKLNMNLFINN